MILEAVSRTPNPAFFNLNCLPRAFPLALLFLPLWPPDQIQPLLEAQTNCQPPQDPQMKRAFYCLLLVPLRLFHQSVSYVALSHLHELIPLGGRGCVSPWHLLPLSTVSPSICFNVIQGWWPCQKALPKHPTELTIMFVGCLCHLPLLLSTLPVGLHAL